LKSLEKNIHFLKFEIFREAGSCQGGQVGRRGQRGGGTVDGRVIFEVLGEKYSLFQNLSFRQNIRLHGNPF
jgi:hypothetical protein